jgi:hypothetical protein
MVSLLFSVRFYRCNDIVMESLQRARLSGDFALHLGSSSKYSIRPRQHIGRNGETNLLGGFEIDDQFELRRLLDG